MNIWHLKSLALKWLSYIHQQVQVKKEMSHNKVLKVHHLNVSNRSISEQFILKLPFIDFYIRLSVYINLIWFHLITFTYVSTFHHTFIFVPICSIGWHQQCFWHSFHNFIHSLTLIKLLILLSTKITSVENTALHQFHSVEHLIKYSIMLHTMNLFTKTSALACS